MGILKKWKDRIYEQLIGRYPVENGLYQEYVRNHSEYHRKHRVQSWLYLCRLSRDARRVQADKKHPQPPVSTPRRPVSQDGGQAAAGRPAGKSASNAKPQAGAKPAAAKQPFLPFLEGAESRMVVPRPSPDHFAMTLMRYDVISFDIFDTLLFRPFTEPRDLFLVLGKKLDIINFQNIRNEMERKAREVHQARFGNREANIYDIYEYVEKYTGIPKEYGIQMEFETELELCFANPYMKCVFDLLKSNGKTVIAVSDMYLPREMICKLLEKCGYQGFDEVFVSCECNANKITGGLYRIVKRYFGADKTFVHVGDNRDADVAMAQKCGFATQYYAGVNSIGKSYRATYDGMSELIGSAYGGIVNAALHNGMNRFSPLYEHGYLYGGLYVLGFCSWLHRKMQEKGIEKILFIARDGDIYRRVFQMLFPEAKSEYLLWSRIVNNKLTAENDRYTFLLRAVRAHEKTGKSTIGEVLSSLSLDFLADELPKSHLGAKHLLIPSNGRMLEDFLIRHWQQVIDCFDQESRLAQRYVQHLIGGCKKIAVVDTGWQGTSLFGLKWLIEEKWETGCEVQGYLAASQTACPTINQYKILTGELETYLFDRAYNRMTYDFHAKTNKGLTSFLFELFTQACHPTFQGFFEKEDGSVGFSFGVPEVENYDYIREIHSGIYDFCREYAGRFQNERFMLNISGHDAYVPFRLIARNPAFFKRFMKDMTYSIVTGSSSSATEIETIGDMFRRSGL